MAAQEPAAGVDTEGSATEAASGSVESEPTDGTTPQAAGDANSENVPPQATLQASDSVVVEGGGLFESAGEDSRSSEASAGTGPTLPFELGGYVRSDVFVGKIPKYDRAEVQAGYGELALQLNAKGGELADAHAELRFRYGQQLQQRQLFTDLREAYVDAYLGELELRMGKQIIVWGKADAFNPTNNLTPADLTIRSPVDDDRRVGNVGARAFWNLLPVRIEGVWMPLYKPVTIPDIALPKYVYFAQPVYPSTADPDLAYGTFAGRVHLQLDWMEGSVSYLHGYAPMPGIELADFSTGTETEGPGAPRVNIRRRAYNHDVVGADFSTALGDYGIRAESAYRKPLHYQRRVYAPRPDLQYVVGVDRSFESLSLIVQYMGRYTFDWQSEHTENFNTEGLTSIDNQDTIRTRANNELRFRNQILFQQLAAVQHMLSLRAEYLAAHETLSLSAFGMRNFTTKEWLLYPRVRYTFSDTLSGTLGGEIYWGPENTLLDLAEETLSAGYAELRYTY